jgi:hypothetical protein
MTGPAAPQEKKFRPRTSPARLDKVGLDLLHMLDNSLCSGHPQGYLITIG